MLVVGGVLACHRIDEEPDAIPLAGAEAIEFVLVEWELVCP